jgi:hypothetical protein
MRGKDKSIGFADKDRRLTLFDADPNYSTNLLPVDIQCVESAALPPQIIDHLRIIRYSLKKDKINNQDNPSGEPTLLEIVY